MVELCKSTNKNVYNIIHHLRNNRLRNAFDTEAKKGSEVLNLR